MADRKTQSAVVRQLEIIGEAVKNLSKALTNSETKVPWRQIAGTRDRFWKAARVCYRGRGRVDRDHWITSSARSSSACGIVSPSAVAVFRFSVMPNSLAAGRKSSRKRP